MYCVNMVKDSKHTMQISYQYKHIPTLTINKELNTLHMINASTYIIVFLVYYMHKTNLVILFLEDTS